MNGNFRNEEREKPTHLKEKPNKNCLVCEGPVAAALGRPCGWEQWSGVPTHAGHMVEARLVVPVARAGEAARDRW